MLRSMDDLKHFTLTATDGNVGNIKDFLFDDLTWVIRYLVVETGTWLFSRKVLISSVAIKETNWDDKILTLLISKDQVKNSPNIDTDKPVSRQHEMDYLDFYGYPFYWEGNNLWGGSMTPYAINPQYTGYMPEQKTTFKANHVYENLERLHHQKVDPNLRSCQAVIGYHIHAKDGQIGHITGILVEESNWAIRYFVVKAWHWYGGREVLISPEWITALRWVNDSVSVDLSRQKIKDAPVFDSSKELNRQHEESIYEHYELYGYWRGITNEGVKNGES
ncbi:MAG: PRC-barrel domain-containing protein [Oleibacter sp.]|nr:PRC-barrel domain-containing protein [Thalassolituus sp.]